MKTFAFLLTLISYLTLTLINTSCDDASNQVNTHFNKNLQSTAGISMPTRNGKVPDAYQERQTAASLSEPADSTRVYQALAIMTEYYKVLSRLNTEFGKKTFAKPSASNLLARQNYYKMSLVAEMMKSNWVQLGEEDRARANENLSLRDGPRYGTLESDLEHLFLNEEEYIEDLELERWDQDSCKAACARAMQQMGLHMSFN